MEVINDAVFGEMKYKHRWYKDSQVTLFGQVWPITVTAKAYSGSPITDQQRSSYETVINNFSKMATIIADLIKGYINDNIEELSITWRGAKRVNSSYELAQIVKPKTLLIKPDADGTTLVLFECLWDEHGIAVQLIPDAQIGPQDMFL